MQITVTAGKGGTGKTTVATNLALVLKDEHNVQFLDCDVEEPDAHIFLKPKINNQKPVLMKRPQINEDRCTHCVKCAELCAFNAIAVLANKTLIYPQLCHGCGLCYLACPANAITEVANQIGVVESGNADGFRFFQGILAIGDPLAPPIIEELKNYIDPDGISILDSPPGTACPAVATIHNSDFTILVTEPTPFGLHDLKLAIKVCDTLEVPYGVVINRDGIGDTGVKEYCEKKEIPVLMRIPNRKKIAIAYSNGIPFVEVMPDWKEKFIFLLDQIELQLKQQVVKF